MIKKKLITFTITILLSIFVSVLMIQNNRQIKTALVQKITSILEHEWNASVTTDECTLDLFTQSLTLHNGFIKPHNYNDSSWGFKKVTAKLDLLALLMHGEVHITLSLHEFIGDTTLNKAGSCNLFTHLTQIFTPTNNQPSLIVDSVTIQNAALSLKANASQITILAEGLLTTGVKIKNTEQSIWSAEIRSKNSKILINDHEIFTNIQGVSSCVQKDSHSTPSITSNYSCKYNALPTHDFVITGTWNASNKTYTITNSTEKTDLLITLDDSDKKIHLLGTIPLSACTSAYTNIIGSTFKDLNNAQGVVKLDLNIDFGQNNYTCSGFAELQNISNIPLPISEISIHNFFITNDEASASFTATLPFETKITGTSHWDNLKKQGLLTLTNVNDLEILTTRKPSIKGLILFAREGSLTVSFNNKCEGIGSYTVKLTQEPTSECATHKGTIVFNEHSLRLIGKSATDTYEAMLILNPTLHCSTLSYATTDEKEPVINLVNTADHPYILNGFIKYSFLQSLMNHHVRRTLLGKNNYITFTIDQTNPRNITGSLKSKGSNFCIPEFNNLIKDFTAQFALNIPAQELACSDIVVNFSKGSICCPQLRYNFNAEDSFLHAPIQINNLLINWKKDFHSFIYGNILAHKQVNSNITELIGNIVLKKTMIKGDFFAQQKNPQYSSLEAPSIQGLPIKTSLRITTEKPALIKTATLETHASANLLATYDCTSATQQLKLTGAIDLEDGYLKFLENKLFIDYGKIQFITSNPEDAMIDLIAKNRINKYTVSMQASGSLRKNSLVLESTPELSEEQILSLLLAGSENASLQSDLPIMLMQNLNTYLLSSSSTKNSAAVVMQALSKPLKYFQISPIFTDQAGHSDGGIKGTFSYVFNDQIRAQLQKNLTFTQEENFGFDDVWFNIEYLVSDDINVKLVREQHGDVGSEVEIKFKF